MFHWALNRPVNAINIRRIEEKMYMGNITEKFGIIHLVRTQKSSLTPDMTSTCVYQMEIGIYWD